MKKLFFAVCMLLISAAAVNAQDTTSTGQGAGSSGYSTNDASKGSGEYTEKESINVSELPSIVSEQLNGNEYSGWTMGNAYRKEKDGKTMYAVEMTKGAEKKMVKFDAQGNKLMEKSKDKDK
jgi:hypothetical protein